MIKMIMKFSYTLIEVTKSLMKYKKDKLSEALGANINFNVSYRKDV